MKTKAIVKSKILPMLMGLALAFGVLALVPQMTESVYADDPAPTSGKCGKNLNWTYNDETHVLTISGTGDMYDYDFVSNTWSYNYPWWGYNVSKVVVEEGVTSIGECAFCWCRPLEEAVLPESLKSIGSNAFDSCGRKSPNSDPNEPDRSLTVNLPSGLTFIGEGAFCGSGIKHIAVPKGVKNLERTFDRSTIETVDLGEVENIGEYTFYYCMGLKQVTLPKTLKEIGDEAFAGTSLTEVIIPEGVMTIGHQYEAFSMSAFNECRELKTVVLPSTLTYISEYEFGGCDNLSEIDFRGTQEQWNKLMAGIDPTSPLGKVVNNPNIEKVYDYIDPIDITNAKVLLSATTFTYNGKIQRPSIKTVGGNILKEGADYTAAWSNGSSKNAGEYAVTITGIGNYYGKTSATYSINKAANTVKAKGKTVKVKASKLKKKNQTVKRTKAITVTSPQGKVTYKKVSVGSKKVNKKYGKKILINKNTGKITVKKGLKKGTYKVKVKVMAAGSANYNKATRTVTFTIKIK